MSFGAMPRRWIAERQLAQFSSARGVVGRSIAALKCYLAIAAHQRINEHGTVMSFFDISKIAKLSKPTLIEGLAILEASHLIEVENKAVRNTNRYVLPGLEEGFRKVPQDKVCDRLCAFGNRGVAYLDALKMYLTMLYLRDGQTNKAVLTHEKLVEYTGVRPNAVAAANGILAALGLIHVRYSEWSRTGHPTNEYELLGDFAGRLRTRLRPSEDRGNEVPF